MKVFFEGTPEAIKREMVAWISGAAPTTLYPQKPVPAKPAAPEITDPVEEPVLAEVPKADPKPEVKATPVAPIPKAPDKTYTLNELLTAASPLLDAGMGEQLMAIAQKHKVPSFTQIPPEEFGQVAVELRALGAKL